MDPDPNRHRRSNISNPPYSQQNPQPVNPSNVYQRQSNPNDAVDPFATRSPIGVDGGSFSAYSLIQDPQQPQQRHGASTIPNPSYGHQPRQRANPPQSHQLQGYQDNIARAGPHAGASNNYGPLNHSQVRRLVVEPAPNVHHQPSYPSNTVGPHGARSPDGTDGGLFGQQPATLASPSQLNYHPQRSNDWNAGNPPSRTNLLPPETFQALLPTPPTIPVYSPVKYRIVGDLASSTMENNWIIANGT
ncbi:hypothetical protein BJV77DRAFT_1071133 [Russula vinacea]|nr:hypothetical protein BJV77DRAFT_1071133 [Russula vinacea]